MNEMQRLIKELEKIIANEGKTSLTDRGSYVLGAVFRDSQDLYESSPIIERISDYASDLETKNGSDEELAEEWESIKQLVQKLKEQKA